MAAIASIILHTVIVLIAILLIGLVLIQPSKGGGFGSAFGGVGESVFGAQAMSHLSKLTVILMSIFFALTLILAVLAGHRQRPGSLLEKELAAQAAPSAVKGKDAKAPAAAQQLPEAAGEISSKPAAQPESSAKASAAPSPGAAQAPAQPPTQEKAAGAAN